MLRFDFLQARNLRHAIALLDRHGDEARAGGGQHRFPGAVAAGVLAAGLRGQPEGNLPAWAA